MKQWRPRGLSGFRCALLTLILVTTGCAGSLDGELRKAQKAYNSGHMEDAIEKYEAVLIRAQEEGEILQPEPLLNLGKSYESIGRKSKAISSYQRALQLGASGEGAIHFNIGELYTELEEPRWASGAYSSAYLYDPLDPIYYEKLKSSLESLELHVELVALVAESADKLPNGSEVLRELGLTYDDSGHKAAAADALAASLELDDSQSELWFTLGNLQRYLGELNDAAISYGRYVGLKSTALDALLLLASTQEDLGRYSEALVAYRTAMQSYSEPSVRAMVILNEHRTKVNTKALRQLKNLSRLHEKSLQPWVAISRLEIEQAHWKAALRALDAVPQSYQANSEVKLLRGVILMARGENARAHALLSDARDNRPWDPEPHLALCALGKQMGNLGEALAECERALKMSPDLPDLLHQTATLRLAAGDYSRGVAGFRYLLKDFPESVDFHLQLADLLVAIGLEDEAAVLAQRALSLGAAKESVHALQARILIRQGQVEQAGAELDKAMKINSQSVDVRSTAVFVRASEGELARAAQALTTAIALSHSDVRVYLAEGFLLLARGENKRALSHMQELVRSHPESVSAVALLAQAYEASGQGEQAAALRAKLEEAR